MKTPLLLGAAAILVLAGVLFALGSGGQEHPQSTTASTDPAAVSAAPTPALAAPAAPAPAAEASVESQPATAPSSGESTVISAPEHAIEREFQYAIRYADGRVEQRTGRLKATPQLLKRPTMVRPMRPGLPKPEVEQTVEPPPKSPEAPESPATPPPTPPGK